MQINAGRGARPPLSAGHSRRSTEMIGTLTGHEPPSAAVGALWARLARVLRNWRAHARLRRELDELAARGELAQALADAGLCEGQLQGMLRCDADRAELLEAMMRRVGVDPAAAARFPGLRDIEWVCTTCRAGERCREWLAHGEPGGQHAFCPNADTLDALAKKPS
jgi:uncharacterized protein YjiS (DUF1127 family)